MNQAILWQRAEGALIFAASMGLFAHTNTTMPWWASLLVFFAPDVSFIGYAFGRKTGAALYNAVHIYALGICLLALGLTLQNPLITNLGILWLAHSGFDRALGYGLKLPEGFHYTHLGFIGKQHAPTHKKPKS